LFLSRFISFHATGDWKVLAGSTPTIDGGSKIDELYQAGDRRRWHVDCPNCGDGDPARVQAPAIQPPAAARAHYAAQCCGGIIEHYQKAALVRAGRFVATNPTGLYPSFHVDALISQLTTWDKIAEKAIAAEGDERKMMAFHNNWLGLPYAVKGDAPDWQRLFERREDYAENTVPPLGLLLVAGADVQHSGIWLEVVAFAPDRQSWTVSARFLAGDTTDPNLGAFAELARVYDERSSTPGATSAANRRIMAIDAGDGGRSNQVYAFARHRMRAIAVKGVAGWTAPAIAGQPTRVTVSLQGKRMPGGGTLWPVGTWSLKAEFYDHLAQGRPRAGRELDPPGFAHHGTFLAETYFRQVTAESLKDKKSRAARCKAWVEHGAEPLSRLPHLRDGGGRAARPDAQDRASNGSRWRALSMPVEAGDLFAPAEVLAVERTVPADAEASAVDVAAELERSLAGKSVGRPHRRRRMLSRGI
jgi:phage terminase large subunit GpA-like protein